MSIPIFLALLTDAEGLDIINVERGRIVEAVIDLQASLNAIVPTQRISVIIATAFKTWTNSNL